MYCPKCEKDLAADATFCPYCGNEKLIQKEEPAAETVEETTEATAPTVTEEATEQPAEAVEIPASAPESTPAKKSGKTVVIAVLCVLIVLAACAAAFAGGFLLSRGDGTPDATDVTTDTPATTDPSADADLFPDDYTKTYPDGFDYKSVDMSQYVTLGKYKGLTATVTTNTEVTADDVSAYIRELLAQYITDQDVTDRPAKVGDTVVIDYVGTINGVAFESGTASDQKLTIGAGGYIVGFEDGIVGMQIGETKTIDVTFPENYHNAELAGKPAQFTFTLDSISEKVAPEYTDAFVREKFEIDTMAEFEDQIETMLRDERAYELVSEKQDAVYAIAVDNATVNAYPEGLVEDYMHSQIDYVKSYAEMYSMSYEELTQQVTGMTVAAYEAEVRAGAMDAIKQEMVLFAIAEAENITAPEDQLKEAEEYYLDYYGAETLEELCTMIGVTETYFRNTISFSVIYAEVLEFLVENATFNGAK